MKTKKTLQHPLHQKKKKSNGTSVLKQLLDLRADRAADITWAICIYICFSISPDYRYELQCGLSYRSEHQQAQRSSVWSLSSPPVEQASWLQEIC